MGRVMIVSFRIYGSKSGSMSAGEFLHGALHRPEHPAYKPIQLVVWVLIALSLLILLCEQTLYLTPKRFKH